MSEVESPVGEIAVPRDMLPKVMCALYDYARPVGLGRLHANAAPPTEAVFDEDITVNLLGHKRYSPDYINGRPIPITWQDGVLKHLWLYDRDHGGPGTAFRIVSKVLATR